MLLNLAITIRLLSVVIFFRAPTSHVLSIVTSPPSIALVVAFLEAVAVINALFGSTPAVKFVMYYTVLVNISCFNYLFIQMLHNFFMNLGDDVVLTFMVGS